MEVTNYFFIWFKAHEMEFASDTINGIKNLRLDRSWAGVENLLLFSAKWR